MIGWLNRRRGAALAASLVLNMLLAGVIAGHALRGAAMEDRRGPRSEGPVTVERLMRGSDRELRGEARAMLKARGPRVAAAREAVREASGGVVSAAGSEPFDAAAVSAALERLRGAETALAAERHGAFVDLLALMPAERRADAMARASGRLERKARRGWGEGWD
ncbi:periplasmic heavy metal sensor [Rubrimonas cliftonensis]|uniref:Uncharacterized membrane protein n=1 Tax=Rubrimonas cliftonensis TaxID=89524 RepID=A0A1H4C0A5_9RHOB|nr:periplasmic heavy metal sensor [Rubrimonas cliftonensis]SEA53512.1 Uncharacterized membrane protein [Rubrimonas cliftonensis]